jgi:hypothetical protein
MSNIKKSLELVKRMFKDCKEFSDKEKEIAWKCQLDSVDYNRKYTKEELAEAKKEFRKWKF